MFKKILGMILILISLAIWSWLYWPIKPISRIAYLKQGTILLDPSVNTQLLVLPVNRVVTLNWSPIIRLGDVSTLELTFTGSDQSGAVGIINPIASSGSEGIFLQYNLELVTKVDLLYFNVSPSKYYGQTFQESLPNKFSWQIKPSKQGDFEGVVWVYMQMFPKNGGEKLDKTLFAFPINYKVTSIFGLNTGILRVMASLFLICGSILLTLQWVKFKESRENKKF